MANAIDKYNITPFNGKNYDDWRYRVECLLEYHDCQDCIVKELNDLPEKERESKDTISKYKKAKILLVQSIGDGQLEYVKGKSTAKQMWDGLRDTFRRGGILSKLHLNRKLVSLQYDEKESLEEFFKKFDEIAREFKAIGGVMDALTEINYLLLALPESFDAVVTALDMMEEDKLTINFVKGKLLDFKSKRSRTPNDLQKESVAFYAASGSQEKRQPPKNEAKNRNYTNNGNKNSSNRQNNQSQSSQASKNPRFLFNCYNCGKVGHRKADCKYKGSSQNSSSGKPEEKIAMMVETNFSEKYQTGKHHKIEMYADSGATDHMVNERSYLSVVSEIENESKIKSAKNGEDLTAKEIGKIQVKLPDNCNGELNEVLFVPDIRRNLLSVSKLDDMGLSVLFADGKVQIMKGNKSIVTGYKEKNLYKLEFDLRSSPEANLIENSAKPLEIWHRRYGHPGNTAIQRLIGCNMVSGLKIEPSKVLREICEICVGSKQTEHSFSKHFNERSSRPLEIVHSDICGPFEVSKQGKNYFVSFIDDFTHFCIVDLIVRKSEVFEKFREYVSYVSAHFNLKVASLRCDRGGEYSSRQFQNWCAGKGIKIVYTTGYAPQQNGVSERMNRTLVEKTRAMLGDSKLPRTFWDYAVQTAAYLQNRIPTTALKANKTPAEMFYNQKPDIGRLRIFGSIAYRLIPKGQRNKLDSKSEVCVLVGYTETGYVLWNPDCDTIRYSRSVVFDESKNYQNILQKTTEQLSTGLIVDGDIPINEKLEHREVNHQIESQESTQNVSHDTNLQILLPEGRDLSEVTGGLNMPSTPESETLVRRSTRIKKHPKRFEEYEMSAMSAESFFDDVPKKFEDIKGRQDEHLWLHAVKEELENMERNGTWTLCKAPDGVKVIDNRWVFRIKDGHICRYKARLVACGYQQKNQLEKQDTYAPVARMVTLRTMLSIATHYEYEIIHMDVKSAFLNGKIKSQVYMKQPSGLDDKSGRVCFLHKAIYGLKESPRCWYESLDKYLINKAFVRSKFDQCLYRRNNGNNLVFILLYVDDLLLIGAPSLVEETKEMLRSRFEMSEEGSVHRFLGINISRKEGKIVLNQSDYIDKLLQRFNMVDCSGAPTPMEPKLNLVIDEGDKEHASKFPYRELLGCLSYVMLTTRPDLSFAVNYFSRFQENPTTELTKHLKRILRFLKSTKNLSLVYSRTVDSETPPLVGYADSNYATDQDRKSTSGYLFKCFGNIVSWCTKKQTVTALSTAEAEYIALTAATQEGLWLRNMLNELLHLQVSYVQLYEDNQSAIAISKNVENVKRSKHIDVRFYFLKEKVDDGEIKIEYIPSKLQPADVLTKAVNQDLMLRHRSSLNLCLG